MQLLGPLWEGAPPAGGGGENLAVIRNALGTVEVLSLRLCGATSLPEEASLLYQQINQESITVAVLPIPTVASAIFFQLAQPHTPSAVRPNRRWHALSAFSVAWPKMPSSVFVE